MAKSHKLFLAALLLAGGYGVALLLGSLSSWIVPQSAGRTEQSAPGGALVPMSAGEQAATPLSRVTAPTDSTSMARYAATQDGRSISPPPIPMVPLESPIWVASAPEPVVHSAPPVEPPAPSPLAKVTDVSPWGATEATAAASPWDRWPQWDPGSNKPGSNKPGAATNAAYDGSKNARQPALQASYQPQVGDAADYDDTDSSDERTHVVVDGDSLAKLADRYLDDPQLAGEIYEMNRSVLTNPDLLPIGVELRIPERRMASARRTDAPSRTTNAAAPQSPNSFVPVENWLDAANDVPRAQLLQPVAIGRGE